MLMIAKKYEVRVPFRSCASARGKPRRRDSSKENKSFIENNKTTAAFDETRLLLYAAQHWAEAEGK